MLLQHFIAYHTLTNQVQAYYTSSRTNTAKKLKEKPKYQY